MYSIRVERNKQSEVRFALDNSVLDHTYSETELSQQGILLTGWVASAELEQSRLFLEFQNEQIELKIDRPRNDVKSFLQTNYPALAGQSFYGFSKSVKWPSANATLVLRKGKKDIPLCELFIEGALTILRGYNDWLFLDNDSNRSVEQYKGEFLLPLSSKVLWLVFLVRLRRHARKKGLPYAFLVAPTKEAVLPEEYPVKKGKSSPVEQVVRAAQLLSVNLVYSLFPLRVSTERTFRKTDTHWSLSGARISWLEAVDSLGLPIQSLVELFSQDEYKEIGQKGDLGNKVYPSRTSQEKSLVGVNYRSSVVYDNFLPNFGRVIVTINVSALFENRLVLFGSSSSYTMLNFVFRTFKEVVFIHSAGSIDANLTELLKPDYLVMQSNARFLVRPPSFRYCLPVRVAEKLNALSRNELHEITAKTDELLKKNELSWIPRLHEYANSQIKHESN